AGEVLLFPGAVVELQVGFAGCGAFLCFVGVLVRGAGASGGGEDAADFARVVHEPGEEAAVRVRAGGGRLGFGVRGALGGLACGADSAGEPVGVASGQRVAVVPVGRGGAFGRVGEAAAAQRGLFDGGKFFFGAARADRVHETVQLPGAVVDLQPRLARRGTARRPLTSLLHRLRLLTPTGRSRLLLTATR